MRPPLPWWGSEYTRTPARDAQIRQIYVVAVAIFIRREIHPRYLPDTFQQLCDAINRHVDVNPHIANQLVWFSVQAHSWPQEGGRIPRWLCVQLGIPVHPDYFRNFTQADRDAARPPRRDYGDPDLDELD